METNDKEGTSKLRITSKLALKMVYAAFLFKQWLQKYNKKTELICFSAVCLIDS